MKSVTTPGVSVDDFLLRAMEDGYSMQDPFIHPSVGSEISRELKEAGFLEDYTELIPTALFRDPHMVFCRLLHKTVNEALGRIEGWERNHIPLFSVRVFEAGEHGTTIHRNHPSVGPWAVGITLKGEAPFNVYDQDQLFLNEVRPLVGNRTDPTPLDSMNARAGSGWTLYTENELVPHSSGLVNSDTQRELLILYDTAY